MHPLAMHSPHLEDVIRQLENSWLQMIENNQIDKGVRPVIAESWKRSLKYGVPYDKPLPRQQILKMSCSAMSRYLRLPAPLLTGSSMILKSQAISS